LSAYIIYIKILPQEANFESICVLHISQIKRRVVASLCHHVDLPTYVKQWHRRDYVHDIGSRDIKSQNSLVRLKPASSFNYLVATYPNSKSPNQAVNHQQPQNIKLGSPLHQTLLKGSINIVLRPNLQAKKKIKKDKRDY